MIKRNLHECRYSFGAAARDARAFPSALPGNCIKIATQDIAVRNSIRRSPGKFANSPRCSYLDQLSSLTYLWRIINRVARLGLCRAALRRAAMRRSEIARGQHAKHRQNRRNLVSVCKSRVVVVGTNYPIVLRAVPHLMYTLCPTA